MVSTFSNCATDSAPPFRTPEELAQDAQIVLYLLIALGPLVDESNLVGALDSMLTALERDRYHALGEVTEWQFSAQNPAIFSEVRINLVEHVKKARMSTEETWAILHRFCAHFGCELMDSVEVLKLAKERLD